MLKGRGDGSCLGLKGWIDNEIGAGQVSVSCKLAAVFLYDVVWHLIFRLEGNVNNLDVIVYIYFHQRIILYRGRLVKVMKQVHHRTIY